MPSPFDNIEFAKYNKQYVSQPIDTFADTVNVLNQRYDQGVEMNDALQQAMSSIKVDDVNNQHLANRATIIKDNLRDLINKGDFENGYRLIKGQFNDLTNDQAIRASMEHYGAREKTKEELRIMYDKGFLSKTQYDDRVAKFNNYGGIGAPDELGYYDSYSFDSGTKFFDVPNYINDEILSKYQGGDKHTTSQEDLNYINEQMMLFGMPSSSTLTQKTWTDGKEAMLLAKKGVLDNKDAMAYIQDEVDIHNRNNPNNQITVGKYIDNLTSDIEAKYNNFDKITKTQDIPLNLGSLTQGGGGGTSAPDQNAQTVDFYNTPGVSLGTNNKVPDVRVGAWGKIGNPISDLFGEGSKRTPIAKYEALSAGDKKTLITQINSFASPSLVNKFNKVGIKGMTELEIDRMYAEIEDGVEKLNALKITHTYFTPKPYLASHTKNLFGGATDVGEIGTDGTYANVPVYRVADGKVWNNGIDWLTDVRNNLAKGTSDKNGAKGKIETHLQSGWENTLATKAVDESFAINTMVTINGEQYAFGSPSEIRANDGTKNGAVLQQMYEDDVTFNQIYRAATSKAAKNNTDNSVIYVANPMITEEGKKVFKTDKYGVPNLEVSTIYAEENGVPTFQYTIYNPLTRITTQNNSYTLAMQQMINAQKEKFPGQFREYGEPNQ